MLASKKPSWTSHHPRDAWELRGLGTQKVPPGLCWVQGLSLLPGPAAEAHQPTVVLGSPWGWQGHALHPTIPGKADSPEGNGPGPSQ